MGCNEAAQTFCLVETDRHIHIHMHERISFVHAIHVVVRCDHPLFRHYAVTISFTNSK